MRIFSIVVLVAVAALGALLGERENLADYFAQVGLLTALFCLASLTIGYGAAKAMSPEPGPGGGHLDGGRHPQHHHRADDRAASVLDSTTVAVPSAVYSVVMYVLAVAFGYAITRGERHPRLA